MFMQSAQNRGGQILVLAQRNPQATNREKKTKKKKPKNQKTKKKTVVCVNQTINHPVQLLRLGTPWP
jgi:hypothetical protein